MKRFIVMFMLLALVLAGCSAPEGSQATEAPDMTPPSPSPAAEEIAPPLPGFVAPLSGALSLPLPESCTVAASISEGDVFAAEDGKYAMKLSVYDYERFGAADVAAMDVGSVIVLGGEAISVSAIERSGESVIVNGGLDVGGFELYPETDGVYYSRGYNDSRSYYEVGQLTLPIADSFVFTDASDLDQEPVDYSAEDLLPGGAVKYFFFPRNTTVRIENGSVLAMERVYIP